MYDYVNFILFFRLLDLTEAQESFVPWEILQAKLDDVISKLTKDEVHDNSVNNYSEFYLCCL